MAQKRHSINASIFKPRQYFCFHLLKLSKLSIFVQLSLIFLFKVSVNLTISECHQAIVTTTMYVATRICFRFLCLLVRAADQSEIKAANKSLIPIVFLLRINLNQMVSTKVSLRLPHLFAELVPRS